MRRLVRGLVCCAVAVALMVGCSDDGPDGQEAARTVAQSEMPPTPALRSEPAPPKLASARRERPARERRARSRSRERPASGSSRPASQQQQAPAQPAPAPAPKPAPRGGGGNGNGGGGDAAPPRAAKPEPEVVECDPRCP
jgi:hypothetical protein